MICPLCDHAQRDGFECEVCGRSLLSLEEPPVFVEMTADLQPTTIEEAAPKDYLFSTEEIPGFETTNQTPGAVELGPRLTDFEATANREDSALVLAIEPIDDLEHERFHDEAPRAAGVGAVTACPNCGVAGPAGSHCDSCGAKLPPMPLIVGVAIGGATALCRACGTQGQAGRRCVACGTQLGSFRS